MKVHFYQANLPHWQPPEGTFFITYRLYGSMPKPVIGEIKTAYQVALRKTEEALEREVFRETGQLTPNLSTKWKALLEQKQYEAQKRYFKHYDDVLDSRLLNEPHWLKRPDVAALEADNIRHYAERYFELYAYCIMSNHVHLLLRLKPGAPVLWKVLQDMKKYSARHINRLLGRQGKLWEDESYDHLVRKDGEFDRILWYILNNPVKAALVQAWEEYPFTFCRPDVSPNPGSAQ